MDWVDLASSCEFSNKPSGSIKRGDFLDLLTNCQLPKNDSVPCTRLIQKVSAVSL